ncbi:developmental pluripotency-associated protein 3 isoform X2 [Canis lupus dingo]|uniref:developmental pluripotency-associated protein 3 isoform X2 n=1 Tax=Canis lupus dingo TaxID=286419 RepID=UPI0020C43CBE|nr:developmental pluripotency-associated protein 3 isoform X2 [Canis lupus dingo]XP_048958376.1 developmental pluripotency-associated protein 3 isoform X2 [Canis lupus dingo]XP_048958377.1 developmental pluripotency-associated protein 3 isoform X2 [Canis lupus dingo]XP_048958378.1 developmental pluripotency-associated protein 3 isoform X2 [Canis lupus dingo]XP_048958379.1 developmental pluripotency-associated protein 3 isoform X2 [Canis lupus dingo]XP_048958380.1 developmental pluripotency-ass
MGSPKQLHPSWAPGSSQMFPEEHSQEGSAPVQTMSEVLVKNLSKLTLDPSIKLPSPLPDYPPQQQEREKKPQGLVDRILSNNRKRSGVRTLLTARKERMERMIRLIQYQRYLNKRSMLQKDLPEQEIEGESRVERFRCTCHYCLYHKDVSEDTSMENNYDTEPIYPNSFLKLSGHACGFFVLYACVYLSLWSYFPHHLQQVEPLRHVQLAAKKAKDPTDHLL